MSVGCSSVRARAVLLRDPQEEGRSQHGSEVSAALSSLPLCRGRARATSFPWDISHFRLLQLPCLSPGFFAFIAPLRWWLTGTLWFQGKDGAAAVPGVTGCPGHLWASHSLVKGRAGTSLIWFLLFAQVTLDCRELFCKSNLVGLDLKFILRTFFEVVISSEDYCVLFVFFLSYLDSLLEQSIIFLWAYNFLPMLQPLFEWEWMCICTQVCECVHVSENEWIRVCEGYLKFFFSYFVWKSLFYRFSRV